MLSSQGVAGKDALIGAAGGGAFPQFYVEGEGLLWIDRTPGSRWKTHWKAFARILDEHGIENVYHFTDRSNVRSIKAEGALLSRMECMRREIAIPCDCSDAASQVCDQRDRLSDFVRLSFTPSHPMMHAAIKDRRIKDPVVLEVSAEVVLWNRTAFCPVNAIDSKGLGPGWKVAHLKSVRLDIATGTTFSSNEEKRFLQAEILVHNNVPWELLRELEIS